MSKFELLPITNTASPDFDNNIKINNTFIFADTQGGFSVFSAEKTEEGNYRPNFHNFGCRSYMGEALFHIKGRVHFPKRHAYNNLNNAPRTFLSSFNHLEGDTIIGIIYTTNHIENFKNNFEHLNKLEEKYDIPLSTYTVVEDKPNMVIVTGSGMWKDSCWKIQLYTYLLKTLCYNKKYSPPEREYAEFIKKYEKELLGNISMSPDEEIFALEVYAGDNFNRHTHTGFVSICQGLNPPMAELLGITPTNEENLF